MIPATGVLAGPYLAAAGLLGAAGAQKLFRPTYTVGALRIMGLPVSPLGVRAGAAAELSVAAGAVVVGGEVASLLVAASYLAFAVFVAVALLRGKPIGTCGCFGRPDTPPRPAHVVLNLAAAGVALTVSADHAAGLGLLGTLRRQPLGGIPFLLLTAALAYLAYLAMTELPRTLSAGANPARHRP